MNKNVKVKGECSKYPSRNNEFSSYYDEKSVGSMTFYKCQTCPYMALAEDDIKIHLFTTHASLAKQNGLLENIELPCPGCMSVFDSDSDIRTHLKKHHKMGLKDIKKLVKSLMQVAIKTPKLKKQKIEDSEQLNGPLVPMDLNIPQVIEIIPDIVLSNTASANGISVITLDELQSMTMPNFEKVDPKEIIKEASINIVYADDNICHSDSITHVANNTPDLISSVQSAHNIIQTTQQSSNNNITAYNLNDKNVRSKATPDLKKAKVISKSKVPKNPSLKNVSDFSKVIHKTIQKLGLQCTFLNCSVRLQSDQKLKYHVACHFNGRLRCPECSMSFRYVKALHTHLWKRHSVDMELPTCEQCSYKTYSLHRLNSIHKKIHEKKYQCTVCPKSFKNSKLLANHRLIHKEREMFVCSVCQREFRTKRQHRIHMSTVHDKIKPFLCGYCGYSTSSKPDLKLHIRLHTGEKPYACQECNFKTGDHNSFRRHKRKHSANKYYNCKHCSYKCIQASTFKVHLLNNHADLKTDDMHSCPYCTYTTVNKSNFLSHLSSHKDEKNIQAVILATKMQTKQCTKPLKDSRACTNFNTSASSGKIELHGCDKDCDIVVTGSKATEATNCCPPAERETVSIEIEGCKIQAESVTVDETLSVNNEYKKHHSINLTFTSNNLNQTRIDFVSEPIMTPNSSSNNIKANHTAVQSFSYCNNILNGNMPLPSPVSTSKVNESNFINIMPRNQIGNTYLHNKSVNIPFLTSQTSTRLPFHNNLYQVSPVDSSQRNSKVTGPIIKPSQILPVPSQGTSRFTENDIHPRKKPKISVKSNLILKGPDEMNMFHSQQKMAFKRLEDNEHRINMNNPISFNNLYNSQFMQLSNEPVLTDSHDNSLQNLLPFTADNMLSEPDIIQSDNSSNSTSKLFNYNQDISVKNLNIMSQQICDKHAVTNSSSTCNNSNYIKLESHQNIQYSLMDKIRNENILINAQDILNDYCKTSPPLEDLHKNVGEIKNEVKADIYSSQPLTSSVRNSPALIESNVIDNITNNNEFYVPHMDLMVLPDIFDCGPNQWQDIIEIDDNSNDNKQLTKFDTFPISPLLHNDFCFLDNESPVAMNDELMMQDVTRNSCQVQFMSDSRKTVNTLSQKSQENDFSVFINGSADPMMNAAAKSAANKINVKNIELMMNTEFMKDN